MSEQKYTPTTERKIKYPENRKTRPAIDRFMERVDQSGDCWEWTARKFWDGYGIFYIGRKTVRAHRWSYEHFIGPISDGLVIDHLCRNRSCVNPAHLEPVTNRENVMRGEGVTAKNAQATHCPHGHPYDEKNTRTAMDGGRVCRTCHRVQQVKARRAKMHHFTDDELAAHDAKVARRAAVTAQERIIAELIGPAASLEASVRAFKSGWHRADIEGRTGERVAEGLRAVVSTRLEEVDRGE